MAKQSIASMNNQYNFSDNRIYNKIVDRDWFSARLFARNRRAITWVSNYSCQI